MRRLARLQVALGLLWVVDALLQLQPDELGRGLSSSMVDGAMAQPAWIQSLLVDGARAVAREPVATSLAVATVQLLLGAAILVPRTRRAGLLASVPWALAVWLFGEGLGGVATGFASAAVGAPGAALLYAAAALALLPPRGRPASSDASGRDAGDGQWPPARFGVLGEHGVELLWGGLWAALAALQSVPVVTLGFKLSAGFQMASLGEPAALASMDHLLGSAVAHHGTAATAALVTLELAAGSAALARGAWRRRLLWLALGTCTLLWAVGEDLGGLLTGSASDVGTLPVYGILAACLLAPRRPGRWTSASRTSTVPAPTSAPPHASVG